MYVCVCVCMCVFIEGEIVVGGVDDKFVIAGKVEMNVRENYD